MKNNKKTLKLVLSARWFNEIESNGKKEEYRSISDYNLTRILADCEARKMILQADLKYRTLYFLPSELQKYIGVPLPIKNEYTHVTFYLGYGKKRREMTRQIESVMLGKPKREWYPTKDIENLGIDFDAYYRNHFEIVIKLK